ncbi:MAG: metalloregulator ArsR/SmtB family transcription factor [Cyanobacteria bacterium P01_D01_bin.44]
MEPITVFKVLANKTRLQILQWLKVPAEHFSADAIKPEVGVCVGDIQKKAGLAQSTVSHYLAMLESAGFVIATREGQWTYYRRNEAIFHELAELVKSEI